MTIKREELIFAIHTSLAANPDWLGDAISAVNSGAQEALNRASQSRAKVDAAFLSALALTSPERMSDAERHALNKTISAAIDQNNMCELERKFIERCGAEKKS
jgi:hypothetical protein